MSDSRLDLDDAMERLLRATTLESLRDSFQVSIERLGYQNFDAYSINPDTMGAPDHPENFVLLSHELSDLQDFIYKGYTELCPVTRQTQTSLLPIDYLPMLEEHSDNESVRWQQTYMAGWGVTHAWIVPIPGDRRVKAVCVYMTDTSPGAEQRFLETKNQIHLLSVYLFEQLERLWEVQPGVYRGTTPLDDAPPLSPRQRECLLWAANGFTNRDIAMALDLSENTVRYHLKETFKKLEANTRGEAVANAARLGLV